MDSSASGYLRVGVLGILALCAIGLIAPILIAASGDTIADRELGQGDFSHNFGPSFVRAKSLNLNIVFSARLVSRLIQAVAICGSPTIVHWTR